MPPVQSFAMHASAAAPDLPPAAHQPRLLPERQARTCLKLRLGLLGAALLLWVLPALLGGV
jgi:hypothetical protein